jgi:hypothetical protein
MRLARAWLLVTRARYVSASAACDSVTAAKAASLSLRLATAQLWKEEWG